MKAKLINEYSKRNKNDVMQTNYTYLLNGTDVEITSFLESDSAKSVATEDDDTKGVKAGDNLWITSRYEGESIDGVVITKANRVAVDRSEERKLIALASRFGKAGDAIIAEYIKKKMHKVSAPTETPVKTSEVSLDLDLD